MKLVGEARIPADRERVWQAINDPEILRQCIPGCEDIARETPVDWVATVVTRVGPVKARFGGRIHLEDLMPPESCRIVGEGSGGAAGFAKGFALVRLSVEESHTRLNYEVESEIGGKLAQIGSRLVEAFAKKYATEFFEKFGVIVGQSTASTTTVLGDDPVPIAEATAASRSGGPIEAAPTAQLPANAGVAAQHFQQADSPKRSRQWFDPQSFTILVLAALLVFMTIMYACKS